MTLADLAAAMDVPRWEVNDLVSGKLSITEDIALKLEQVLRIDAIFWITRERLYRQKMWSILNPDK